MPKIVDKLKVGATGELVAITDSVSDYTAFEVLAHAEDIPKGYSDLLGGNTNKVIPANTEHRFCIRTTTLNKEDSDVVVDWGDGEETRIGTDDVLATSVSEDGEMTISLAHEYKEPGKYIVKVLGRKYFAISYWKGANLTERNHYNLMCRAFDSDLPLRSNLTNISSFCAFALRLKSVKVPSYYNFSSVENASYLFYASGVETVTGLENLLAIVGTSSNMFDSCGLLTNTDAKLPIVSYRGTWAKNFYGCTKLTTAVSSMFYPGITSEEEINVNRLFMNCSSLPAEDLSSIFWGNPKVNWVNTAEAFVGCSEELRAMVPTSWGGTATDIVPVIPYRDKLKELEARLELLESKINN
jgi:hypothetical protein